MVNKLENTFFVATRDIYTENIVKYSNVVLLLTNENYDDAMHSFDWGSTNKGTKLLASTIAKENRLSHNC